MSGSTSVVRSWPCIAAHAAPMLLSARSREAGLCHPAGRQGARTLSTSWNSVSIRLGARSRSQEQMASGNPPFHVPARTHDELSSLPLLGRLGLDDQTSLALSALKVGRMRGGVVCWFSPAFYGPRSTDPHRPYFSLPSYLGCCCGGGCGESQCKERERNLGVAERRGVQRKCRVFVMSSSALWGMEADESMLQESLSVRVCTARVCTAMEGCPTVP